jgi:hypothetical protein
VNGTTAVHICFGYAAIIHARPSAYSFLPELADSSVHQVSIETAQSGLVCSVLKTLPGKTIILGTFDLSDMAIESGTHPPRATAFTTYSMCSTSKRSVVLVGIALLLRFSAGGVLKTPVDLLIGAGDPSRD